MIGTIYDLIRPQAMRCQGGSSTVVILLHVARASAHSPKLGICIYLIDKCGNESKK
ncbi:hypothetical protein M378DRAFT_160641 [Amanita muscaria Koide BX008]|uniref:Uncharacterized protein n=1 Tax=Amanita muscaria (strain Koide BX008) TaxID=946122 RepID=A0A0C2XBA6_AMAMK|nr:hypothetical protein M378DRAFT_160641 [Amanita muscaria Koide BX008]